MPQLARTTILTAGLVAGTLSTASAVPVYTETVVHDTTTSVSVKLDASTVLCSSADYGALFLKILIPDLARLTLLDHQNTGAGAPCVAAGSCGVGQMPEDIIDAAYPNETVAINVKAIRADESDVDTQTCNTYLIEKVNVTIRGVAFFHERQAALGSRAYADCAPAAPAPEPEPESETGSGSGSGSGKPDDYGKPELGGGGCSAATGGAGGAIGLAVVLLCGLAPRRRRANVA